MKKLYFDSYFISINILKSMTVILHSGMIFQQVAVILRLSYPWVLEKLNILPESQTSKIMTFILKSTRES